MPRPQRTPRRGERRLRRSLAALLASARRTVDATPPPLPPDHPQPASPWEQATELRLAALEQQLANQNRLLLLTLVSVMTDVLLGLAR